MKLDYDAVVCDIEGTTTPISFVHDTLFPYAVSHLKEFVEGNWQRLISDGTYNSVLQQSIEDVSVSKIGAIKVLDINDDVERGKESLIDYLKWQIACNCKTTTLKKIQGEIWKTGYMMGDLRSYVYRDVVDAFKQWNHDKIPLYIYSSGSNEAQKLLFQYSNYGNLLQFINGHFDTTTGSKVNRKSYIKISETLKIMPNRILFLTDIEEEAVAASTAGYQVCIVLRDGNKAISDDARIIFNSITSFYELIQKQ